MLISSVKLVSLRKLAPSRNVVFNQTGMDFVTELSFCIKPRLLMTKSWFLEVASQLGKSFKASVRTTAFIRRRTHSHNL